MRGSRDFNGLPATVSLVHSRCIALSPVYIVPLLVQNRSYHALDLSFFLSESLLHLLRVFLRRISFLLILNLTYCFQLILYFGSLCFGSRSNCSTLLPLRLPKAFLFRILLTHAISSTISVRGTKKPQRPPERLRPREMFPKKSSRDVT